jgi:hypothetical protein
MWLKIETVSPLTPATTRPRAFEYASARGCVSAETLYAPVNAPLLSKATTIPLARFGLHPAMFLIAAVDAKKEK